MSADAVAAACLIAGALLCAAAGLGLLRFPDTLSRMHTTAKPQVLGLILVLIAVGLRLSRIEDLPTLALIAVFQLATVPVAAHMVGRAAYRSGVVRRDLLIVDDLAADEQTHRIADD